MVRKGSFRGISINKKGEIKDPEGKLQACWDEAKDQFLLIKNLLNNLGITPRTRTLVLLEEDSKRQIIQQVWQAFKKLLPITMGEYAYGLVGASKILFSAFPEIVLPVDNAEWLHVFKTVDLGDVINLMADEIKKWEEETGLYLDECDYTITRQLTLPAIYNVMAMEARPKRL